MTDKELKDYLLEKIDSCYKIKSGNDIYWLHDENYNRKKKLAQLNGIQIDVPTEIDYNKLMFFQDNKCLYIDIKFWNFLLNKYLEQNLIFDDLVLSISPFIKEKFQMDTFKLEDFIKKFVY